jgi:acyl-CoA dehydrogenase
MANLGVLGISISPEYGGAGMDPVTAGIVAEEVGRADISCALAVFYLVQAAWGYIAQKYGGAEFKNEVLPLVTKGKAFIGIAATEPDAGSDLLGISTTAKKMGNEYVINGEKMFISGVREVVEQLPEGGGFLTLVKTNPEKGHKGMSFFYVPLKMKGIVPTYLKDWGRKGISTGGFSLSDVRIHEKYLIGEEGKGFYIAMEGFDYARALIAAVCCGASMKALEYGMEYIKNRKAFGQPIAKFEAIQFKLAEDWARLDAARLLTYKALWLLAKEQEGKANRFEVSKIVAEAKMLAVPFTFEAINDAIHWFGAYGYTEDCPLHIGMKAIRSYEWAEGSIEIMKIIVARELLGKEFVAYR